MKADIRVGYTTIKDFETQELIDFESINTGAVVAVAMSADGSFAKLLVCNGFIDKSPDSYGISTLITPSA